MPDPTVPAPREEEAPALSAHDAAAFWGLAENPSQPAEDRLRCALRALEFFGTFYQAQEEQEDAPAPGTPQDAVAWLRSAADALDKALLGYEEEDWRDAVRLLLDLRKVTTTLGQADASIVRWLYLHGEHGHHLVIDGVPGNVSIGRGRSKERWQVAEAAQDYVEQRIIQNDGEAPDPRQVVAWVLEVLPSGESAKVRKTPLRDAGLEVADYYHSEPGSLTVGLPKIG